MVNYYEVLEVSEKASKEVIEKAYKALAKKYHPDLNRDTPKEAESKMKELNEAFEILTDDSKRANFDRILEKKREIERRKSTYANPQNTSSSANSQVQPSNDYYTDSNNNFYVNARGMDEKTKKKLQNKLQERYLEAYDNYLRERGYKLKYKWTFKRILQTIAAILLTIIILVILFFIPPIHEMCMNLYETNVGVKMLVDLVSAVFKAFISIFEK